MRWKRFCHSWFLFNCYSGRVQYQESVKNGDLRHTIINGIETLFATAAVHAHTQRDSVVNGSNGSELLGAPFLRGYTNVDITLTLCKTSVTKCWQLESALAG